jgi:hypothetical protein
MPLGNPSHGLVAQRAPGKYNYGKQAKKPKGKEFFHGSNIKGRRQIRKLLQCVAEFHLLRKSTTYL